MEELNKKEKGLFPGHGQQCGDCREEGSIRGINGGRKKCHKINFKKEKVPNEEKNAKKSRKCRGCKQDESREVHNKTYHD